jgi:hypothetical protein
MYLVKSRIAIRPTACASAAVLLLLFRFAPVIHAGVTQIGLLNPFGTPSVYISGIAFDGTPNPLVIDSQNWTTARVSLQNATELSSTVSNPVPNPDSASLAYDPTTNNFYTIGDNQYLWSIQNGTLTKSPVGSVDSAAFNFSALAVDPSGNLWLTTDYAGNSLWEINKQTGVGTLKAQMNLGVNNQVTALAIDGSGNFIIYSTIPITNGVSVPEYFYSVNPNTGATTRLSQAFLNTPTNFSDMTAMAYDPVTNGIYGIQENVTANPITFDLVQVTGVPEPGSICLLATCMAVGWWRRVRSNQMLGSRFVSSREHIPGPSHTTIARFGRVG